MKYENFFIESFLIEKQFNCGFSILTIKNYYLAFDLLVNNEFFDYDDFKNFTSLNFKRILQNAFMNNKWSPATYNTRRKCLSAYCNYLLKEKTITENPFTNVPKMKEERKILTCYTDTEVGLINYSMLHLFDLKTFIGIRNFTFIKVLLFTGLRRKEVLNLKFSDVVLDNDNPYLIITRSKGNKSRLVPVTNQIFLLLKQYSDFLLNFPDVQYFFCSFTGKKLQERDLYTILKKIEKKSGFHLTLHKFRHTFATELVKNNFNVYNISQILGHEDLSTTKIYLNSNVSNLQSQLSGLNLYS